MTENPKPPSPARRSEKTRTAILTAAVELLEQVGYGKLTVEAIAARAGAGKQTIYRWWPSKSAVVMDAFRELNHLQEDVVLPDTGDLRADLVPMMRDIVDEFNTPKYEAPARIMLAEAQGDPGMAEETVELMLKPALEATKNRLRSAQAVGQVRADLDLDLATELLYGPLFHRWAHRTAPLTGAVADRLVDYVLRAIRP